MTTSTLPLDIIVDILSRLPVKSVLRCRCMSKSICSIIDGQNFINLHLKRSIETNSNLSLSFLFFTREPDTIIYSLNLDSLQKFFRVFNDFKFDLIGSCNGLLAIQNQMAGIIVLNPSTKKEFILPKFCSDLDSCDAYFDGFGYDACSDDYKFVRIMVFSNGNPASTEITVYSMKNNSWEKIKKGCPYHFWKPRNGVLAGGALHWLANRKPEADEANLMIAFDLSHEEFYQVPMPFAVGGGGFSACLEVLRGCLSLVCMYDIWVMKEYGVKDSWTKLFTFREGVIGPDDYLHVLTYSKCGHKVLVDKNNGHLYWYDLERQRVESVFKIDDLVRGYDNSIVCMDSLVSLDAYASNR